MKSTSSQGREARGSALVTGAAKRLGRRIALTLAQHGYGIVVHYNTSRDEAEAFTGELREMGADAWTCQGNLADPGQAENVVGRAIEAAGAIDILVNSAAIFPESRLHEVDRASLQNCIDVNALAPLILARRFAAQGRSGCILNMLDCRITDYDEKHAAYHLSKRMLFSLTRMMALEFAPAIRVNAIAPGLILPPEGKDESYLAALASTNPLNTYGAAEDIQRTALFLVESPFITGQVVYVDGGRHILGCMYG